MGSEIELIAGLKGGGEISGESGQNIKKQLDSIMKSINANPLEVEVKLSDRGLKSFKQEFGKMAKQAKGDAEKIESAFDGIEVGSLKGADNITGALDDLSSRNKKIKQAYKELQMMEKNLFKWSASENGKSSSAFDAYLEQGVALERIIHQLEDETISLEDFADAFIDIQAKASKAAAEIAYFGENAGSIKKLTQGTAEYISAMKKVDKEIRTVKAKQKDWSAAEGTDLAGEAYSNLSTQISNLEDLKTALEEGSLSAVEFYRRLGQIKLDLGGDYDIIRGAGKDNSKIDELEKFQKQLKEVDAAIEENKTHLKEWSQAKKGSTSGSYADIEKAIATLEKLRTELLQTGKAVERFDDIMANVGATTAAAGSHIARAEESTRTFGGKILGVFEEIGGYIDVMDVVFEAISFGKEMVSAVTDIDTAMTELRKVTNETNATYASFLEEASTRARELGSTVADVISSSADFARLGHDLEGASALADAAIVYKNVGDGINDIETASSSIISTMQAFGIEAENAMSIVDKFNEVGNNFAVSSAGIGDALLNSAASLAAAGNSLDESIALIAAANTTIQDPGRVGTALKTLSMYLRAAKTEAEDAGISTEGMAESVSQLRDEIMSLTGNQVDIMSDVETGSYKSTVEILRELSKVWNDLSDTSRTNITELIGGGVRNANIISALMKNFELVDKAMETSAGSSGSALAENEKYLDSIVGKTAQFQAAFEALSATVVDSDLIKGFVDAGTFLLDATTWAADNLGGLFTSVAFGNIIGALSGLKDLDPNKGLGKFFNGFKSAGKDIAGGSKWTLHQIRPPHRDGNIERADIQQGDAKQMVRGLRLDKWCA